MNVYLDFEANNQEIIAVGAIDDNDRTFYSLVKPHSKLTKYIGQLTHISQEELDAASNIDVVIQKFIDWLPPQNNLIVFGHCDKIFIKQSALYAETLLGYLNLLSIVERLNRVDQIIAKRLKKNNVSLKEAYKMLGGNNTFNIHNALEDAKMLKYIYNRQLLSKR